MNHLKDHTSTQRLVKIYENQAGVSFQCDSTNTFLIEILGKSYRFDVCSLISFRKKIMDINVESLLLDSTAPSTEIIYLGCTDSLFIFSIEDIVHLKDLLEGTFAMLQLNSIIHSSVHRAILI